MKKCPKCKGQMLRDWTDLRTYEWCCLQCGHREESKSEVHVQV